MKSLILQVTTRFLITLLLLFSLFLVFRGHNEPGGGFVGGLVASAAFALYALAYDVESARRGLGFDPRTLIGTGLLLAALSGLMGLVSGRPFLTGLWSKVTLSPEHELHLGTPLLFDVGVFVTVMGVLLTVIFSLAEE